LNRVSAESSSNENGTNTAGKAIDGIDGAWVNGAETGTRWASAYTDPTFIEIDLGARRYIDSVTLHWENAYSSDYEIQVSDHGDANQAWNSVFRGVGAAADQTVSVDESGRYVRMYSHARATVWGNSLWEFEVFGDVDPDCQDPTGPTCNDGVQNQDESDVDCGGSCAACNNGDLR
jgi:hypothetical protein